MTWLSRVAKSIGCSVVIPAGLLLVACAEDVAPPELSFSVDAPLEVAIEIDDSDWDTLRNEGRGLALTLSGCADIIGYEYTEVPADITIDGVAVDDVLVRKKGLLGSLSALRPSLRIELTDDAHPDRNVGGLKRLTLNNNLQDKANAHQCMTYALFEQAGLVAPRCGLAHVTVNGVDRGFYTNVEPIKKPFLARAFGDDSGNLYESAAVSEFTPEYVQYFELKTNETESDRSDLDRVLAALEADDADLMTALESVFDVDELFTFWAMETLTGHSDGLTGNRNNTYLYRDPQDDRFHLIPWGTDGAFSATAVGGGEHLRSVFATSRLSSRLYAIPTARVRYHARLRELLDQLWDEDVLVAQLHHIAEISGGNEAAVMETESFIRSQRRAIEDELAQQGGLGPDVESPVLPSLMTCVLPPTANAQINHTWNAATTTQDAMATFPVPAGGIAIDIPLGEGALRFVDGTVVQSASTDASGSVQFGLHGLDRATMRPIYVGIIAPAESYRVGRFDFHGFETFGVVLALDTNEVLGLIGDGSVTLDAVGVQTGDAVRGEWHGLIAPLSP